MTDGMSGEPRGVQRGSVLTAEKQRLFDTPQAMLQRSTAVADRLGNKRSLEGLFLSVT